MPTKLFAYMAHTDKVYLYSVLKVMPVWFNQNGYMPKKILPIWPTQISVSLLCLKTMPVWYLTKMATISKIIYCMKNNKPPM